MRLDQLQLVDDSRLGLALVWMIIILDAAFSSHLGAARLFDLFGRTPTELEMAALEFALLIGLTVALVAYQFQRARRQLGLRPLADMDARLHADANYVSQRVAAGRPRFLVSANVLDGNAFCLSIGRYPTVVLGGGLRLMLRKKRQQACAIIAHECGHVSAGDTVFLLLAWYTFIAYCCLVILEVVFLQYYFWANIPDFYAQSLAAGLGSWDFLKGNFPLFLSNGILKLLETAGVGVVLAHFIRQREYRADEVAARAGWRAPLIEALVGRVADTRLQPWSLFARFHPRPALRAARLQDESEWAKIDFFFVAAMSFTPGRLLIKLPRFSGDLPEIYQDMTEEELKSTWFQMMLGMVDFWLLALLLVLFSCLATLHVFRVSFTRSWIGYSLLARSATGFKFITATFLGFLLQFMALEGFFNTPAHGELTSLGSLLLMTVDAALFSALLSAFLCWGSVLAAAIMARRAAQRSLAQTACLAAVTLPFGLMAYLVVMKLFFVAVDTFDLRILVFYLPYDDSELLGGPSLIGKFVIVAGLLFFFGAMKLDRRRVTPKLHPSWLARDDIPKLP